MKRGGGEPCVHVHKHMYIHSGGGGSGGHAPLGFFFSF